MHSLLSSEGKASSLAYIQSWKYLIYLLSIEKLIETRGITSALKEPARIISKVYSSPVPTIGQVLGQKLLQLSRLNLPGAALDLSDSALDFISADGGEVAFADVKANPTLQTSLNQSIERLTAVFEKGFAV